MLPRGPPFLGIGSPFMSAENAFVPSEDAPSLEAEPACGSGVVRVSRRVFEAPTVRPPVGFVLPIAAPSLPVPPSGASAWSVRTMPAIPPHAVATMVIAWSEVRELDLTHTDAFFLSLIDGGSTVETLVDMCGMPRVAAYTTLARLIDLGIVQLDV